MKNMKISKKLTISYVVILMLLIISMSYCLVTLSNLGSQVETFYNGPFQVSSSANIISENFESMQKSVYRSITNEDSKIVQEAIQNAQDAASTIQEQIPIIQEHFLGDQAIVTNLQSQFTKLSTMRETVLKMVSEKRADEAANYMEENNIPAIEQVQLVLDELIKTADNKGEELIQNIRFAQTRASMILFILGIASVLISVVFALYITGSITKPILEVEEAAENLAKGNLDTVITYYSGDELGRLAESMRITIKNFSEIIQDIDYLTTEIAKGNFDIRSRNGAAYVGSFKPILLSLRNATFSLSETLAQINQAADQVSSGSDQVSFGAQALSQGATEQASSVEELAATIDEISTHVIKNAENAQQASSKADEVGQGMVHSNQMMQEMIDAMHNISNSSNEISKIIKTIEDIAFQTNVLALNAAVEAARAGVAGKGFAVVADEVRSLASKAGEASKNTAELIDSSIRAVEDGRRIADETAKSLLVAVEGAQEVVDTINLISNASEEQAGAISQVSQGVDQISNVVQTNSATAEESAAASEELSGQAQMLKVLVNKFTIRPQHILSASAASFETDQESIR